MKRQYFQVFAYMRHVVYILILVSYFSVYSHAEELRFSSVDSRYGLNQGSINGLTQDDLGFVWLGTEDGLARYDGSMVKVYRNDPDNIRSLPDNFITGLLYGSDKRLWVGSEGDGASYYDYATDQFIRLNDASLGKEVINFFSYWNDSAVLIQTGNGLFSIDKNLSVKQFLSRETSANIVNVLPSELGAYVLLGTGERIDLKETELNPKESFFFDRGIKQAWLGENCPIVTYDVEGIFHCPSSSSHPVNELTSDLRAAGLDLSVLHFSDFVETVDGTLWLSSNIGLLQVKSGRVLLSKNIPNDPYSLSSNKLNKLLLGKGSRLFIGTDFKGLSILDLSQQGIEYYRTTNTSQRLTHGANFSVKNQEVCGFNEADYNMVWTILKASDGALWVGNYSGLAVKPAGKTVFEDFSLIGTEEDNEVVCSVWSLAEANGLMWFGTWYGLISYSQKTHKITHYRMQNEKRPLPNEHVLSGDAIRVLLYDKQRNSLWVGTNANGLNKISFTDSSITHYVVSDDEKSLPHSRIRSLFLDDTNNLWVGSGGGLSLWNEASDSFQTIKSSTDKTQLSDEDVRAIYQSDENYLWVGTGNGLNLFNKHSFQVESRLNENHGLSNSNIYSLVPDAEGKLWITTANGLSHFDPVDSSFTNYYAENGLQANEFNFNAWHKGTDGKIYVGGVSGLNVINPELLKKDSLPMPIVLTSVVAYDAEGTKAVLARMVDGTFAQTIRTQERNLKIRYSLLSFGEGAHLKSQFRLTPDYLVWSESPQAHTLDYTNLKPGSHLLQIKGLVGDGDESMAEFEIYIEPYFWETWWFRVLAFLVLVLLTALLSVWFYKIRSRGLVHKQTSQDYRIVEHELRPHLYEARNQLTLLAGQDDLSPKHTAVIEGSIKPMLVKSINFIEGLRTLIDLRSTKVAGKQLYMLEDIVDEVKVFFSDSHHRIVLNEFDDINVLAYENSLYLVIRNLVSNAMKYSESDTKVELNLTAKGADLIIECIDCGIGIEAEMRQAIYEPYKRLDGRLGDVEGLGIGLTIVRFIVHSYQGTVLVEGNHPKGSRFMVTLKGVIANEG